MVQFAKIRSICIELISVYKTKEKNTRTQKAEQSENWFTYLLHQPFKSVMDYVCSLFVSQERFCQSYERHLTAMVAATATN